jgi:hypothetical protein
MPFNLLAFLQQEALHHVIGPAKNVRRGHVGLNCPFCGDTRNHLSYNLKTGKWGCWRCPAKGVTPEYLVKSLKGCSLDKAKEIVRSEMLAEEVDWEELTERARNLFKPQYKAKPQGVQIPKEFGRPKPTGLRERFWDYLVHGRGFAEDDTAEVVEEYGFLCSLETDRLIIPVIVNGQVIGWTGRTIHKDVEPRYKVYPTGDAIKQGIPFHDVIKARKGGEVLAIVEGGLDAPKLDFYGKDDGLHALPIMGVSATASQVTLILKLAPRYRRTLILLDEGAEVSALHLSSQLASCHPAIEFLPSGVKDPGVMSPKEARRFSRLLLGKHG